jgi:hypothetical protein
MTRENPFRQPEIIARVREFIAADPKAAGNVAIARLVMEEFHVFVTPGQVAGGLYKEGITRGTGMVHRGPVKKPAASVTLPPLASETPAPVMIVAPKPPPEAVIAAHDRQIAIPVITSKPPAWRHPPLVDLRTTTPRPAPTPKPILTSLPLTGKCRWPLWPTGARPTHKYCDANAPLGTSWCIPHRKIVYGRAAPQDAV